MLIEYSVSYNLFFCHCRWAKLRSAMIPSSILMEPLTECMILGLLTAWAVSFLFQWDPISFFLIHITLWFIMDAILIRVVQNGPLPFNKVEFLVSLQLHTVRNLHFLSENSTLISRENCRFFWGEKLVKMLRFWTF